MNSSVILTRESEWRNRHYFRRSSIAKEMRPWLFNDLSLTRRLMTGCPENFQVEVLRQRYAQIQKSEARLLDIPLCQYALLREVFLHCGRVRIVYARSVIPLKTLTGNQRRLAYLGERPLGSFLFSYPNMRRGQVQLASIQPGSLIYARATQFTDTCIDQLWGRRSVFWLATKPLIVAEIFLPTIHQALIVPTQ